MTKSGVQQEGTVAVLGSWPLRYLVNRSCTTLIAIARSGAVGRGSYTRFAPLEKLLAPARCTPDAVPSAGCTLRHLDMHGYPSAEKGLDLHMVAWGRRLSRPNLRMTTALRARKIGTMQHRLADAGFNMSTIAGRDTALTVHGFVHFSPVMNGCNRACWGDHRSIGFMLSSP